MARKPLFQEEKKSKEKINTKKPSLTPATDAYVSQNLANKGISKNDPVVGFLKKSSSNFKKATIMDRQERLQNARKAKAKKKSGKGKTSSGLWISDAPQIVDPFGQQGIDIKKDLTKPEQKAVQKNIEKVVKEQGEDPKEFKQRAKKGELSSGFVNILSQGLGLLVGGMVGGDAGAAAGHSKVIEEQERQLKQSNLESDRVTDQANVEAQRKMDEQKFAYQQKIDSRKLVQQKQIAEIKAAASKGELTDSQAKSKLFGTIMDSSEAVFEELGSSFDPTSSLQRLEKNLPRELQSTERQQFDQAANDFVNAINRRTSGATIKEEEMEDARERYIPQPGNTPEVLAQKKAARLEVTATLLADASLLPDAVLGKKAFDATDKYRAARILAGRRNK